MPSFNLATLKLMSRPCSTPSADSVNCGSTNDHPQFDLSLVPYAALIEHVGKSALVRKLQQSRSKFFVYLNRAPDDQSNNRRFLKWHARSSAIGQPTQLFE
jgi:hypothetical protein